MSMNQSDVEHLPGVPSMPAVPFIAPSTSPLNVPSELIDNSTRRHHNKFADYENSARPAELMGIREMDPEFLSDHWLDHVNSLPFIQSSLPTTSTRSTLLVLPTPSTLPSPASQSIQLLPTTSTSQLSLSLPQPLTLTHPQPAYLLPLIIILSCFIPISILVIYLIRRKSSNRKSKTILPTTRVNLHARYTSRMMEDGASDGKRNENSVAAWSDEWSMSSSEGLRVVNRESHTKGAVNRESRVSWGYAESYQSEGKSGVGESGNGEEDDGEMSVVVMSAVDNEEKEEKSSKHMSSASELNYYYN